MRKFIRYYKNIAHSLTQTLKPFIPMFIIKMVCKKKKLSLVTGTGGYNFRLSGDCLCNTSAEPRYCVNSAPRDRKIQSAPVTGERLLYYSSYLSPLVLAVILEVSTYLRPYSLQHSVYFSSIVNNIPITFINNFRGQYYYNYYFYLQPTYLVAILYSG